MTSPFHFYQLKAMTSATEFKELGDDLFYATAFWVMDEVGGQTLYQAATCYDWALVQTIQDWPTPSPFEDSLVPPGDKCLLLYADTEVKIRVPLAQMIAAWQEYIKRDRALNTNPLARNISAN
jgi:hypothetical protein